jgi:cellulose synthase (UDP-forming)
MTDWYFTKFESRRPPAPVAYSARREFLFQALATGAVALGCWYLYWRWTASLNWSAWWFAVPLVVAETLGFIGTILFFLSIWRTRDTTPQQPPMTIKDIDPTSKEDRPLRVDVFFPTYNEDVELVRLSVRDAKAMRYPHAIDLQIHVLDDGKRAAMKAVCDEEKVGYHTRSSNIGFKAGNLRNAMEQTSGDLLVICDADTRPFPDFLEKTLGYFRDAQVAWVQTPQWFYDLDEGTPLPEKLGHRLGALGRLVGRAVERVVGPIKWGADPLGNDPVLFYDVIQRRRNWCSASFCCGAGSVHRREAVMEAGLKTYATQLDKELAPYAGKVADPELQSTLRSAMLPEAAREVEFTPYKFHVSEDIYTSIALHSDPERSWKSVFHPEVLSRMLSPQDLLTWSIQRFKYAGGTLDIFWNDNPLKRALSPWQRVMYGTTIYSYLAPLWTVVFLLSPIVYFFTATSPVSAYNADFYMHFLPFIIINRLAYMAGTWGIPSLRGEQYYLAFFWLNLKALRDVLLKRPIKFHVTPKTKQAGNFLGLVWPQASLIALSAVGICVMSVRLATGSGDASAFLANLFWTANNMLALWVIVSAALHKQQESSS